MAVPRLPQCTDAYMPTTLAHALPHNRTRRHKVQRLASSTLSRWQDAHAAVRRGADAHEDILRRRATRCLQEWAAVAAYERDREAYCEEVVAVLRRRRKARVLRALGLAAAIRAERGRIVAAW